MSHSGPQNSGTQPYPPQMPHQQYGQQYTPPPGRLPASPGKRPTVHPMAIAGLFLGCVALICALTPLTIVGSILGVAAAVLAVVGLIRSASKGLAVAALIVAVLALPVGVGHWLVVKASQPAPEEVADCISKPNMTAEEMWACAQ